MPWAATHVFWGDERCVPSDDVRSNERMAREALLDHVPIPGDQIHPMRCEESESKGPDRDGDTAGRAAERYERVLRGAFPGLAGSEPPRTRSAGLDLVILGLGEDGHAASLFPYSMAAAERQRWVAATLPGGTSSPEAGLDIWRVSLTTSFINLAGLVIFLVQGSSKAQIVREVLEADATVGIRLPACLIRPVSGRLLWLLDREAAALLANKGSQNGGVNGVGGNGWASGAGLAAAGHAHAGEAG